MERQDDDEPVPGASGTGAHPGERHVPDHEPSTGAHTAADGSLVWLAECPCGWRGPERTGEPEADLDRWDHVDPGMARALRGDPP